MASKKKSAKKPVKKVAKGAVANAKRSAKRAPAKAKKRATAKRATAKRAASPAIVHWEIQAQDAKKVQRFYGDLFGWSIDAANPMNYGMVSSQGEDGINGGIGGSMNGARSRVLVYANVDDINETLAKAEQLGARTIMPRTDLGMVIMGIFEDVEGNHFGLVEG
jgi:predicted enzyme related to lactoylglutathione lyase